MLWPEHERELLLPPGGHTRAEPAIAALQIRQPPHRLVATKPKLLDLKGGEGGSRAFAGQDGNRLPLGAQRQGADVGDMLLAGEFFMVAQDRVRLIFSGRPNQFLVLIEAFVHGCLERLHGGHLAVEFFGAAHRFQPNVTALQPTETGAVASKARSQPVTKSKTTGKKTSLRVD